VGGVCAGKAAIPADSRKSREALRASIAVNSPVEMMAVLQSWSNLSERRLLYQGNAGKRMRAPALPIRLVAI
jgi:hypothetical protein